MVRRCLLLAILVWSATASVAEAQARRTYWGVDVDITPKWRVPAWQEVVFDAQQIDLAGSEFRIGFVRGQSLGGDWGLSFVSRSVKDASAAILTNDGDVITTADNSMMGVEIGRFSPFTTIKDRVQIGLSYAIGVGWYGDTVSVRHPNGSTEVVDAKALFSPNGINFPVTPLGRFELSVGGIITQNIKVRASGGISFPGQHTFRLSAIYLFAPR
jgi:hypothetical protein